MAEDISPGDRVFDDIDREWRTVESVVESTVFLTDGGVMGIDECTEVRLASEPLDSVDSINKDAILDAATWLERFAADELSTVEKSQANSLARRLRATL